jgi:ribosomal protein L37AE/L43A
MSGGALVPHASAELVTSPRELTVDELVAQTDKIRDVQRRVMKSGVHYGVIPGTDGKPTLLKAGAETLCLLFRLAPEYEIVKAVETPDEVSFTVRCTLVHIPTGVRYGSGLGSATSREKKYQREAHRRCPRCSKETIFHSKDPAGGWFCWAKRGGCGVTFVEGDTKITSQIVGRVTNPDLYDAHNSILKIAQKRAFVGTTLNCTAASDAFTQDLDEVPDGSNQEEPPGPPPSRPAPTSPTVTPDAVTPPRVSMKQLHRFHALCGELAITGEAARVRVAAFLARDVPSVADLTSDEMTRVIARMETETTRKAGEA